MNCILHLHAGNYYGKAFGKLSAGISGAETANEEQCVKQIMNLRIIRREAKARSRCWAAQNEPRQNVFSILSPQADLNPQMCSKVVAGKRLTVGEWAIEEFAPPITFQTSTHANEKPMNTTTFKNRNVRQPFKRMIATAIIGLIIAVLFIPSLTQAQQLPNHSQTLGYSREMLRDEQRAYSACLDRATIELKGAQDRLASGLSGLAERNLITTFLNLDAANIRMQGHEERIMALRSSPLSYSRDKQIQLLRATHADLRAQARRLEDSAFEAWTKQPAGVTNNWKSLPLYISQRADFARRFKDQSLSPDDLIADIQLLQDYPLPLVLSSTINAKNCRAWVKLADGVWRSPAGIDFLADGSLKPAPTTQIVQSQKAANDPTVAALRKLELRTSELDQTVNRLRAEQSNLVVGFSSRVEKAPRETPTNASVNISRQGIGSASSAREQRVIEPPSVTNRAMETITQTVASITITLPANTVAALPTGVATPTNRVQGNAENTPLVKVAKTNDAATVFASSAKGNASNAESTGGSVNLNHTSETSSVAAGVQHIRTKPPGLDFVWLIAAIIAVLTLAAAIALALAYVKHRQNEFELFLTCSTGGREESITIPLDPREQCVLLNGEKPTLESKGADDGRPCIIVRTFGGAILCPGSSQPVLLNGEPLSRPTRLHAGNVIQIGDGEGSRTFTFQGGNFVSPDEQAASLESATTTIN